jgi:hypothetical protein
MYMVANARTWPIIRMGRSLLPRWWDGLRPCAQSAEWQAHPAAVVVVVLLAVLQAQPAALMRAQPAVLLLLLLLAVVMVMLLGTRTRRSLLQLACQLRQSDKQLWR